MSTGARISDFLKELITLLDSEGVKQKDIANAFGISQSSVYKTVIKSRERPKRAMTGIRGVIPDPEKPKIKRPPARYDNCQREEYIDKILSR